ncbi:MAG: hypothetical protein J7521_02150 [Caulobacter sp.]|nr:hypothetical protein [Caulobacter sp.]
MALDREIEQLRADTARWRALARRLPTTGEGSLTDWELDYLEELPRRTWLEHLSYRQAEVLLDIRDNVERVDSYRGCSAAWLLTACYGNRLDLDEDNQAWVEHLHATDRAPLPLKSVKRLLALAKKLGLFDQD